MARLQPKDDLQALRHKAPRFYLPSTAKEPNPNDRLWFEYETGALDFEQEVMLRQYAEQRNTDPRAANKTLWSEDVAKYRLPFIVLSHESTSWNVEVVKNPDDPEETWEWEALECTPANALERIKPSNLMAFGEQLWGEFRGSLGIKDSQVVENIPLESPKKTDTSTKSEDDTSTPSTPQEESQEPSTGATSLLSVTSSDMNSEVTASQTVGV